MNKREQKSQLRSHQAFQQINKGIIGNELSSFLIAFWFVSILPFLFCYYAVNAI